MITLKNLIKLDSFLTDQTVKLNGIDQLPFAWKSEILDNSQSKPRLREKQVNFLEKFSDPSVINKNNSWDVGINDYEKNLDQKLNER